MKFIIINKLTRELAEFDGVHVRGYDSEEEAKNVRSKWFNPECWIIVPVVRS